MSTQDFNKPNGFTRKPEADLYTVLLIFALLALLVGILYLHLDLNAYDYKAKEGIALGGIGQSECPVFIERRLAVENEKGFRFFKPEWSILNGAIV
ncbi:MAG: hypothetical protein JXB10_14280 [Pirellulales bacterium]|nr:hypothetical protein [Pirellulales bacterium]